VSFFVLFLFATHYILPLLSIRFLRCEIEATINTHQIRLGAPLSKRCRTVIACSRLEMWLPQLIVKAPKVYDLLNLKGIEA